MPSKRKKSKLLNSLEAFNEYAIRLKKAVDDTPGHTGQQRKKSFMRGNAQALLDKLRFMEQSYNIIMENTEKDDDTEDIASWAQYISGELKWRKFEEFCVIVRDYAYDNDHFAEFYGDSAENSANAKRKTANKSKKHRRNGDLVTTPPSNAQNTVILAFFTYLAIGYFPLFSTQIFVFFTFFFLLPTLFLFTSPSLLSYLFIWALIGLYGIGIGWKWWATRTRECPKKDDTLCSGLPPPMSIFVDLCVILSLFDCIDLHLLMMEIFCALLRYLIFYFLFSKTKFFGNLVNLQIFDKLKIFSQT